MIDPGLFAALAARFRWNMGTFWLLLTLFVGVWLVAFALAETYALLTGRMPYTGWIRQQLGIEPAKPKRAWLAPLFAFVVGGAAVWFVPHIEKWLPW